MAPRPFAAASWGSSRWQSTAIFENFTVPGERPAADADADADDETRRANATYLTWAAGSEDGVHYSSERSRLQFGQMQRNRPEKVTVLWKKHAKTLTCIRRLRRFHPKYQRYYDLIRKVQVHDPYDECAAGDIVYIKQCKPYSKTKAHVVHSVYKKEETRGHIDANPDDIITNELRRVLDEKKKAVRHSTVFMSEVQELYLERELRRIDESYEKALAGAAQAAEERKARLAAIAAAKERDRQAELHRRRLPPKRSWEKIGRSALEPWRFDEYAVSRRGGRKWRAG